ncbi:MAG: DUF6265 family protein [Chitinophagales bacterium]
MSKDDSTVIDKLVGTWYKLPIEQHKNMIEAWEKVNKNTFTGSAYLLNTTANEQFNTEMLWLNFEKEVWTYTADPVNQEKTDFKGTLLNDSLLLFENPTHDFPQYIQYKWLASDHIEVEIGNTEKKMSWEMKKVEN